MSSLNYNTGIPAANNNPSSDQPLMQTNFSSINTLIGVDHFSFEDNNYGKHQQVQLESVTGIPSGLINGFETLYANVVSASGELMFTRGNTGVGIQMTGPGNPVATTSGSTFLPGGMIMQWGTFNRGGSWPSSGTQNYNVTFPHAAFVVSLTLIGPAGTTNGDLTVNSTSSTSSFVWNWNGASSATPTGFFWIAIGN